MTSMTNTFLVGFNVQDGNSDVSIELKLKLMVFGCIPYPTKIQKKVF